MKKIYNQLATFSCFAFAIILVSCGPRENSDPIIDEIIAQQEVVIKALKSAKNVTTSEEAAKEIDIAGDEILSISTRLRRATAINDQKLQELQDTVLRMLKQRVETGTALQNDPVAKEIMVKAISQFDKKTRKADKYFR